MHYGVLDIGNSTSEKKKTTLKASIPRNAAGGNFDSAIEREESIIMLSVIEKSPPVVEAAESRDLEGSKENATRNQASGLESQRQKVYEWFAPTDSPAERRLILKLDGLIIVFVFLAYWAKVLDSSATSTAYVSGMKEDLKLYGNQLNYLNTVYMYVYGYAPKTKRNSRNS